VLPKQHLERHQTEWERARTNDLMRLTPRGYSSVLDAGTRDGYYADLLAESFESVTALDLLKPPKREGRISSVQGNLTNLPFRDRQFDVVFCTEVLEHVGEIERACAELVRVVRHTVLIGVPYRQDIRLGRTTCTSCGKSSPPWGHVNCFDEARLTSLLRPLRAVDASFVGTDEERTNAFSCWLMDQAENPWGVYDQMETCIHCGAKLTPPVPRTPVKRLFSGTASALNRFQNLFTKPHGAWIHMVFKRDGA
jgi:SAM-dependent methyltransferase